MERSEEEVQALARRRVEARTGFIIHLSIFVVANAGLIIIWALTGARYPWFLWVLFGWGIGLVGHALTLLIGPDSPREQRALEREVGRLRRQPR